MAEILLLEDEESVNRGIEFTLKKEGYEVENAGTIREAWELFKSRNQAYDLRCEFAGRE